MEGEKRRVEVSVRQGKLRGTVEKNILDDAEFFAFRGIPYAVPPVGRLRFKDPLPPEPWIGVRDASKQGNNCIHMHVLLNKIVGSDDCLYLNVYTCTTDPNAKRAVMVWIHGGGFLYGSGDDETYGPDYLIRKDIVLVTFNYRLGALGFLNLDHEVAPGNQGLKDQVMALRWVQENIRSFGGDPNNVTIFGESAGGASVHYLTLSPLADGLFHKAISQSGVVGNPWALILTDFKRYGFRLAEILGKKSCDPEEVVKFLQTVDTKDLIEAQLQVTKEEKNAEQQFNLIFAPTIDYKSPNPFLLQHPNLAMRSGTRVPFMLGHTTDEGIFFLKNANEKLYKRIDADIRTIVHPQIEITLKQERLTLKDLRKWYFGDEPITKESVQKYVDYLTDAYFVRDIYEVVKIQSEEQCPTTYLYKLAYDTDGMSLKKMFNLDLPGVSHADDLMYLFVPYMLRDFGIDMPPLDEGQMKIMECFTELWTNFAKTGNPTPTKTELIPITWEPLEKGDTFNCFRIDKNLSMERVRKGEQRFDWKNMKNKL